ncbi:MAG: hypothetical protein KGI70_00360 [Patescibacteria group bacterium]|nr:hypothetical protein [Patescibacteria group bacterium]
MAFTAERLNDLMDAIAARGMDIDIEKGFEFRLHKVYPEAPRSPIKFNLADNKTRKDGRMFEEDLTLMGEVLDDYALHHGLDDSVVTGIPNVGHKIAVSMQRSVRHQMGKHIPLLPLTKVETAGGASEIARVETTKEMLKECPRGSVVLPIDDVLTHATIGQSAVHRVRQAGYIVKQFLTVLTYGFDGASRLQSLGVEPHNIFLVRQVVVRAKEKGFVAADELDAVRRFLQDMNVFLQRKAA